MFHKVGSMCETKTNSRVGEGVELTRRDLVAGLGGLAAGLIVPDRKLQAQASITGARRFDFHHHFASPRYFKFISDTKGAGYKTWAKDYTVSKDIDAMDKAGVATAFISLTTPGISFGNDAETRALARDLNDFGAKLVSDYKGRFALFAVLPLPNIDASLREIEYAFDTLKAVGAGVITSYEGKYLGDPKFAPILQELNRARRFYIAIPSMRPAVRI